MSRKTPQKTPTTEQYSNLQQAYDYFNQKLFDGDLADCIITLRNHGKRTLGLFHAEQWVHEDSTCHEIALAPAHLDRPLEDVFGTLVHEMCHLWQQDSGKPSRNGYHNKEWGDQMKAVGLYPSNTGKEGGKETGQQMTHYTVEGGPFAVAFEKMPDAIRLPWIGVKPGEKEKKSPVKIKYQCPGCEACAWGKPDLSLVCGNCDEPLEAEQ